MNSVSSNIRTRRFTLEQANAMLPLVKRITADIVRLSAEIEQRTELLAEVQAHHTRRSAREIEEYSEELQAVQRMLKIEVDRFEDCVGELESLGLELFDESAGIVHFPVAEDTFAAHTKAAFHCWKLGEASVTRGHEELCELKDRAAVHLLEKPPIIPNDTGDTMLKN